MRLGTSTKILLMALTTFFPLFSLTHVEAAALEGATEGGPNRGEMNGIKFDDFRGFETNWKFVTVRYRKDTSEMRFVYANAIALSALQAGSKDYPDGAVFGKVGFVTKDDPAFSSSAVPSGAQRFQFMVRDKKKYAETGGWGYALFNSEGVTGTTTAAADQIACHACHQIVPERGYVFSIPSDFSQGSLKAGRQGMQAGTSFQAENSLSRLAFRDGNISELPSDLRKNLPSKITRVRFLNGELQKSIFQGTLDEIRPTLANEVIQSGVPAILMANDHSSYVLVFKSVTDSTCRKKYQSTDLRAVATYGVPGPSADKKPTSSLSVDNFCWK